MEHNNTLMRYLQLGIVISLFNLTISCNKTTNPGYDLEVYFVNQTNYNITYGQGFGEFNVKAKSTIIIKQSRDGIKPVLTNDSFLSPLLVNSRPFTNPFFIYFDLNKCLVQTRTTENSVFNVDSYKQLEKIGENTYKLTYTFTEADYNRAVICP
jgi:hypothetical protein